VKINLDDALNEEAKTGGWGHHYRLSWESYFFSAAGRVNVASEALQTKFLALVNVIPVVENQGVGWVIFQRIALC
jgi:hypothetical protein